MLPLFLLLKQLGLVNTYGGVIVPALAGIFGIFLVRQYALSIPDELLEAARIDGAGELRIFAAIVVPLLRPILVTLALFTFLGTWNDFMWPLIVLTDARLLHAAGRAGILSREHVQDNELMMAGSVLTVLPVLLLFLALQRYYIAGLDGRERQGMRCRIATSTAARCAPRIVFAIAARVHRSRRSVVPWRTRRCDRRAHARRLRRPRALEGGRLGRRRRVDRRAPTVRAAARCASTSISPARRATRFARRALPHRLPRELRDLVLRARRRAGQRLQFKLVDASGDNVWWFIAANFEFPRDWQRVTIKKRQIASPGARQGSRAAACRDDRVRGRAGRGGGKGSVVCQPSFELACAAAGSRGAARRPGVRAHRRSLPAQARARARRQAAPRGTATGGRRRAAPHRRFRQRARVRRPRSALARRRACASRYDVEFSDDGDEVANGAPIAEGARRRGRAAASRGRGALPAPRAARGAGAPATRSPSSRSRSSPFGASPNAFFQALAREAPRGRYPRGFSGEQTYWTLVGVDGGSETACCPRTARSRSARGGFSIEPFVVDGLQVWHLGRRRSRAVLSDRLSADPGVTWHRPAWSCA